MPFKKIVFLIFSLSLVSSSIAVERMSTCENLRNPTFTELNVMAQKEHPDRGIPWSVEKDTRTSYLYSTVHVAKIEWDFPGASIVSAIAESSYLAVELDMTNKENHKTLTRIRKIDIQKESERETDKRISALFNKTCVSEKRYSALGSAGKVSVLNMYSAKPQGFMPDYAIDIALTGYFNAFKKPIIEIETAEEQAAALGHADSSLSGNIDNLESGATAEIIVRIATAWSHGDLEDLLDFWAWCNCSSTEDDKAAMNRLLGPRNRLMADRLDSIFMAHDHVFAAIGVLHMIKPDSVLFYLEEKGYKIRRVNLKTDKNIL
jgi:uncharacterized protein YbaP (TraB family)